MAGVFGVAGWLVEFVCVIGLADWSPPFKGGWEGLIVLRYTYDQYPGCPNGSDFSAAGICTPDGRHLAMMPHLERAFFPWQCGYYPADRKESDQITPWIEAFVNARKWVETNR